MSDGLHLIARVVAEQTGMRIRPERYDWLAAAVERLGAHDGRSVTEDEIAAMVEEEGFVERLIDEVTIRETFFLREHDQLRSVDWPAMLTRARAAGRDHLRVWSAGCSSGEEPYTLAMLARDALGPQAPMSVLGTDIAEAALTQARAGWYGGRTVKLLADEALMRHFRPHAGGLCVEPAIRELVRFKQHNLVSDPSPPDGEDGFDLVVCRNLLIHLEPRAAIRAGEQLAAALHPGGTLLLAPADRLCITTPQLGELARGTGSGATGSDASRRRRNARRAAPHRRPPTKKAEERSGAGPRFVRPADEADRPPAKLSEAVRLADAGRLDAALDVARQAAHDHPMDASAHLITGVIELAAGSPERAVSALRRALYLDPSVAIASFHLGRAREAIGDRLGAEQAYERALHALDPEDHRHGWLADSSSVADVAEACKLRLLDLRGL